MGVDLERAILVGLGAVDVGVGGAVDDDRRGGVGAGAVDGDVDGGGVGDVESRAVDADGALAVGVQDVDDVAAELTAGAGDEPPAHPGSTGIIVAA